MAWNSVCRDCTWTSGALVCREAADVQGRLHTCENPDHSVSLVCQELWQLLGHGRPVRLADEPSRMGAD